MDKQTIYVVIAGPLLLAAYTREDSAHLHARCITDGKSVPCELTGVLHGRPASQNVIYVVIGGSFVFAAYTRDDFAERHAFALRGKSVSCELLEQIPKEVRDDLMQEWDDDEDAQTPVDPPDPDPGE